MARIQLRECDIRVKDGLAGTAAVNQPATAPVKDDDSLTIDTVTLNTRVEHLVPIGARFTVAGETDAAAVHIVLTRTPDDKVGPTTAITFSPALGEGTYEKTAALTFAPQQIEVKIGDGDLKYTEANQYHYDLDRGKLDTVREGDDVPMELAMNFTFDQVKSGTSEVITPIEAIKGIGPASEWVSTSSDPCEPYSVDVVVDNVRPCGAAKSRTYTFPDFRAEKRDYDFKSANIAVNGKCNATEPIIEVDE